MNEDVNAALAHSVVCSIILKSAASAYSDEIRFSVYAE
jgi:hypothetical protein